MGNVDLRVIGIWFPFTCPDPSYVCLMLYFMCILDQINNEMK